MIRAYTITKSFPNWPTFANNTAAIVYIRDHSDLFDNGETITLVDFSNRTSIFILARIKMDFITVQ